MGWEKTRPYFGSQKAARILVKDNFI